MTTISLREIIQLINIKMNTLMTMQEDHTIDMNILHSHNIDHQCSL